MKNFILLFIPFFCLAQSPQKGFNLENAMALPLQTSSVESTFDNDGNIYVLCDYSGTLNVGNKILKSTYGIKNDKLLIKFNSKFELQWAQSISTTSNNGKSAITTDSENNVYVAGDYDNKSFQFGKFNLPNQENQTDKNIFLMKFNSSGDVAWVHTIGGRGDDFCSSIKTDNNNNIIIVGNYTEQLDFENLSLKTMGNSDMFIAKYAPDGKIKWAKSFGGDQDDFFNEVTTDSNGNIYTTGGFFSSEIIMDNNKLENEEATNRSDNSKIVIVKFDENGKIQWAKTSAGFGMTMGNSICLNDKNEVFIGGFFFKSDVDFQTAKLTYHNEMGQNNPLFLKLTNEGKVLWAQSCNDECLSTSTSVSVDGFGYVYFLGNFNSQSIKFNNKNDSLSVVKNTKQGREDIFIAKFNSDGVFLFANKIGGGYDDWANCLTAAKNGTLLISGTFQSSELYIINKGPIKKFNTDERYSSVFLSKIWSLPESSTIENSESESNRKEKALQDSIAQSKKNNSNSTETIEIIALFESSWDSGGDGKSSVVFKGLNGDALYFYLSDEFQNKNEFCNYELPDEEKTVKSNVGKKYKITYLPKDNVVDNLGEITSVIEVK